MTDSVSGFKLENIKEGTYLLAALKEENPNYTFQPKTDKIGYRKQLNNGAFRHSLCVKNV